MSLITTLGDAKDGAELTKDEARLIQFYRQLNISRQELLLGLSECYAAPDLAAKPAPAKTSLHLIKGGAT